MHQAQMYSTDTVKIGRKGQITLPKKMRVIDHLKEKDVLLVRHMSSGKYILEKQKIKTPEDRLIEIVKKIPHFNWREAWEEVKAERRRERS